MTTQSITVSKRDAHKGQIELFPVREIEVDGIQMGVLNDGTPYLTLRGLSRMCGIHHSSLHELAGNWAEEKDKPRGEKIQRLLGSHGYSRTSLDIQTSGPSGKTHAYTDAVCMAVLEYYAFEANNISREVAPPELSAASSVVVSGLHLQPLWLRSQATDTG